MKPTIEEMISSYYSLDEHVPKELLQAICDRLLNLPELKVDNWSQLTVIEIRRAIQHAMGCED